MTCWNITTSPLAFHSAIVPSQAVGLPSGTPRTSLSYALRRPAFPHTQVKTLWHCLIPAHPLAPLRVVSLSNLPFLPFIFFGPFLAPVGTFPPSPPPRLSPKDYPPRIPKKRKIPRFHKGNPA